VPNSKAPQPWVGRLVRLLAVLSAGVAVMTVIGTVEATAAEADHTAKDQAAVAAARNIDDLIKPLVASHGVPALAGLELEGDRIVAIGAAGVREMGKAQHVTVYDQFHLGSDTKAMTATLCAMMVQDGKLNWSSTLAELFPRHAEQMRPEYRGVTVEQLLLQRSGFPADMPAGLDDQLWKLTGSPITQRLYFLSHIVAQPPAAQPGTQFIYSNTNYILAGAIIERVTGKPWEEVINQRLFVPLGMTSAGFGAPGVAGELIEPRGHLADGKPAPIGPGGDNPQAMWPCGGVHCSIIDWAKFVAFQLTDGQSHPGLLRPEYFVKMHTPMPVKGEDGYAMGWATTQRDWAGGLALNHSGSNTMWYATVWMAPKRDMAILTVCNRAGPGDLGFDACDDLCGVLIKDYDKNQGH